MIHSFPPFVNNATEILILGTMPGIASLEKQEYYAHPRNHFWKIIYTLFNNLPIAENFEEKISLLQKHKIGLWDVLENCERKGSLDIHIKNHKENDFELLFEKFGQIKGITYDVMPSTSPANAMSFEKKLEIWSTMLD